MRLLNARTRELEEFVGRPPLYAILSHTWGKEEVSFKDITSNPEVVSMKGYSKIRSICDLILQAQMKNHWSESPGEVEYAWCDICCIDKSSSAELSEAINSSYYGRSARCYIYLEDVSTQRHTDEQGFLDEVRKSRWFTRAWTLQELLAPEDLMFYDSDWKYIGTRDGFLLPTIHEITRIPQPIFLNEYQTGGRIHDYSIATRMSWAAGRRSTREEDVAYSLLGIFGIKMPMLYGEGMRAIQRLQEEIVKTSTDHSIFAHSVGHIAGTLFAWNPDEFKAFDDIECLPAREPTATYFMTNRGLQIKLPIVREVTFRALNGEIPGIIVALNCRIKGHPVTLTLQKLTDSEILSGLPVEYGMIPDNSIYLVDAISSLQVQTIIIPRTWWLHRWMDWHSQIEGPGYLPRVVDKLDYDR